MDTTRTRIIALYKKAWAYGNLTKEACEAWLTFEKALRDYQDSVSEEERRWIKEYLPLESIEMICSGIRSAGLDKKYGLDK